MRSTRRAARDESEYPGRRDRSLFDAVGSPLKAALRALPPTVFTLLVAAIPGSMSIKARYEAETRHLVEVLAAHMQAVIANPPQNVSLEEALKSLVRQAKWSSDSGHANGYFFLYQGTQCLANGGFPGCEGRNYCNFTSPTFRKAIDALAAAAPLNATREEKVTVDYEWPQPGRPDDESAGKVGYSLSVAVPGPGNEGWWLGSAVYTGDLYASWLNSAKWLCCLLIPFFGFSHWYARRRHSRQMLNIVPEGILITNAGYQITFANQESLQIFGYTEAELVGSDVRRLVPEAHREHFTREMDDVDAGKKVVRWHAARIGKGGRPLRVHSMVVKTHERHRRMHVVVDTTKRHQFDLAYAALEQDAQSKQWATVLCVRIHNFEGVTSAMDPDAVPELYHQYRSKVEEAVGKVHGLRVELPPPHLDWTRTVIACIFPDEGSDQQGIAGTQAALEVLDSLKRWQRESRIEMPRALAVQILVRRGYVALSNRAQVAPTVSGKDVARSLGLLDQCPFDRVALSKDVYAASASCFDPPNADARWFRGSNGSFQVRISPLRLTGDDAEAKSERFDGHQLELVEPSKNERRFAVALSFPGERRAFVEKVALHLAAVFTKARVLYDDFHRAELNGLDMDEYLPALYARQSELVVVFFCPEYAKKPWCSLEWRQAIEMRKDAAGKRRVMLSSFGNPGDLGSLGLQPQADLYLDISRLSAEEVAAEIRRKYDQVNRDSVPSMS